MQKYVIIIKLKGKKIMEAKIQLYKQFLEKTSLDIKTIKQMGFSFLDVIIMCIRKR